MVSNLAECRSLMSVIRHSSAVIRPKGAVEYVRWAHILNAALILTLITFSLAVYSQLPDRIPWHYVPRGQPDRWMPTTWANWMMVPVVSLLLTCLFYAYALLVPLGRKNPKLLSLPWTKALLRLSPGQREPILQFAPVGRRWYAVAMNAFFLYSQWVIYRVARGEQAGLPLVSIVLMLAAVAVITTWWILRLRAMILEAVKGRGVLHTPQ